MKNPVTVEELLKELENRLSKGDFKDKDLQRLLRAA